MRTLKWGYLYWRICQFLEIIRRLSSLLILKNLWKLFLRAPYPNAYFSTFLNGSQYVHVLYVHVLYVHVLCVHVLCVHVLYVHVLWFSIRKIITINNLKTNIFTPALHVFFAFLSHFSVELWKRFGNFYGILYHDSPCPAWGWGWRDSNLPRRRLNISPI